MRKIFVAIFLSSALFLSGLPSDVFAREKTMQVLSQSDTAHGDYFAAADTVNISGTVLGDAFIAGRTVLVDGTVRGDLIVAGGSVTVTGEVGQDIRILGGNVILNGKVDRNITLVAGNVSVGKQAIVSGNLVGIFGNFDHLGQVSGSVRLIGGHATVNGSVTGDVDARVGDLTLGDGGRVLGNLFYASTHQADFAPNATVSGHVTYSQNIQPDSASSQGFMQKIVVAWMGIRTGIGLVDLGTSLLVGLLLLRFFPRRMLRKTDILANSTWACIGLGLLVVVVVPVFFTLLTLTIVGFPVALTALGMLAVLAFLSKIWVGFAIGRFSLLRLGAGERRGWAMVVGLVMYFFLVFLPFVGWIAWIFGLFAGIGVLLLDTKELYGKMSNRKLV